MAEAAEEVARKGKGERMRRFVATVALGGLVFLSGGARAASAQVAGFQQCPLSVVGSPFGSLGSLSGFSGSPGGFFGGFSNFLGGGFTLLACTLQQLVDAGIATASSANGVTTFSLRGRTPVTLSAGQTLSGTTLASLIATNPGVLAGYGVGAFPGFAFGGFPYGAYGPYGFSGFPYGFGAYGPYSSGGFPGNAFGGFGFAPSGLGGTSGAFANAAGDSGCTTPGVAFGCR